MIGFRGRGLRDTIHVRLGQSIGNLVIMDPITMGEFFVEFNVDLCGFRGEKEGDEGDKLLRDNLSHWKLLSLRQPRVVGGTETASH
jgi:hypothetical protein